METRGLTVRAAIGLAIAVMLAACSAGPGAGGQLEGTEWLLRSYDQGGILTLVPENLFADAEFGAHQVSGDSGCNRYQALYQSGGRTLIVGRTSATLIACDPAAMAFEQTYLTLLQASRFYTARRDTLTIYDSLGHEALVFDAAPRNPLLGRWNVDSFAIPPSTVTAPLDGTTLDVAFGITSVGGSAGCNTFSGIYGTNGNAVRISRLATTQIACPQDVMDQETAFLTALQGVSFIDIVSTGVNLTDRNRTLVVALTRPVPEPEPSPGPSASTAATAAPRPTPAATAAPNQTPTAAPTVTPTPARTATPTAAPTPSPSTGGSARPTVRPSGAPPIVIPPTATCDLPAASGGPVVAKIVYPGTWYTVTEPASQVCHYFDPDPITVPSDPATIQAAIAASVSTTAYADAVKAATDPANWTVAREGEISVRGSTATCVDAAAAGDAAGLPAGTASFACLVDVGKAGTVIIRTTGTAGDPVYQAKAGVVSLMTLLSTFTPTS